MIFGILCFLAILSILGGAYNKASNSSGCIIFVWIMIFLMVAALNKIIG